MITTKQMGIDNYNHGGIATANLELNLKASVPYFRLQILWKQGEYVINKVFPVIGYAWNTQLENGQYLFEKTESFLSEHKDELSENDAKMFLVELTGIVNEMHLGKVFERHDMVEKEEKKGVMDKLKGLFGKG